MNFRSSGQKVTALVLLLLVSLALVGVAYGLWFKVLSIETTVSTGGVNAEWVVPINPLCIDGEVDKDVAEMRQEVDADDNQILHVTIDNGYPSFTGDCQVTWHYSGSVPARVESIAFVPGVGLTNCNVVQDPPTGSFVATCDQLTVTWDDALCIQVHESSRTGSSLIVHVEQDAPQNAGRGELDDPPALEFDVEVELVQWNESACP